MPTSYTWNAEPSTRSRRSRSVWNLELRDRWNEMRSFEELPADWDLIFDIRSVALRRLLRLRARQQKLVIKFPAIKYSCRNVLVVSGAILALLTTSRAVFVLRVRSSPSPENTRDFHDSRERFLAAFCQIPFDDRVRTWSRCLCTSLQLLWCGGQQQVTVNLIVVWLMVNK